jgi:uncharacterized protein
MAVSAVWAVIPADALLAKLEPQGYVSDFAGVLNPGQRAALEGRLAELERKSGAQGAVAILKSLQGGQIDDFAVKLFKKWGIGQKKQNNGILLLVAMEDHKARVEVGYGLEPILPDALAGRVLDEQLFPAFKQQRYAEGLTQAVARLAEIVERGEPARPDQRRRKPGSPVGGLLGFALLLVAGGWFMVGGGAHHRRRTPLVWGLPLGGVPMAGAWIATLAGGLSIWWPLGLLAVAGAMFVLGWRTGPEMWVPGQGPGGSSRSGGWGSGGWGGWGGWNWGGGSGWGGGGGGFGGGDFGGGGGFGGFGGGSSGGGGASGSW